MLLDEIWLVRLMAAHTEGPHIIFQKVSRFAGTMRFMAIDAPFLHWVMLELCLGHGIADILMTIETELIPRFQKNKLVF